VVVCDEAHVVCVDCTEGSHAVADDGEECNEDVVDNVNYVVVPAADIDPTWVGVR